VRVIGYKPEEPALKLSVKGLAAYGDPRAHRSDGFVQIVQIAKGLVNRAV